MKPDEQRADRHRDFAEVDSSFKPVSSRVYADPGEWGWVPLAAWPPNVDWEQAREVGRIAAAVGTAVYTGSPDAGLMVYMLTGGGLPGAPADPRGVSQVVVVPSAQEISTLVNTRIRESELRIVQGSLNALYEKVDLYINTLADNQKNDFMRETLIPDFINLKNYAAQLKPEGTAAYIAATALGNAIYFEALARGVLSRGAWVRNLQSIEGGIEDGLISCHESLNARYGPRPTFPMTKPRINYSGSTGEYYYTGDGNDIYRRRGGVEFVRMRLLADVAAASNPLKMLADNIWDFTLHSPYGRFVRIRNSSGFCLIMGNTGFYQWSGDDSSVLYMIEEGSEILLQDLNRRYIVASTPYERSFDAEPDFFALYSGALDPADALRLELDPVGDGTFQLKVPGRIWCVGDPSRYGGSPSTYFDRDSGWPALVRIEDADFTHLNLTRT